MGYPAREKLGTRVLLIGRLCHVLGFTALLGGVVLVGPSLPGALAEVDLTGTVTKVTVKEKAMGEKLVIKVELCNVGEDEATGPFETVLFLSEDAIWDDDDLFLQAFTINRIKPGQCKRSNQERRKFKVSGLEATGGKFAIVVIDDGNVIDESNEDNNTVVQQISDGSTVNQGEPFSVLGWNITGGEVAANQTIVAGVFATEDADVIALQETGRGAATIAAILESEYTLVAALDGQDIWIKDNGRFNIIEANQHSFDGGCNGINLGSSSVTLEDTLSDGKLLSLYSVHFCIPDGFRGAPDPSPGIRNENQQQHLCSLIGSMEENASNGTVLLAADFNDVGLAEGESLIAFLQGSGTLNAGFCESTDIGLTEVVVTDVTHIMASGKVEQYSNQHTVRSSDVGFGQHGYVVTSVDLSRGEDGNAGSTGLEPERVLSFDGVDDRVTVPYDSSFPTEEFTITAWIQLAPPGQRAAIIARGEDDNSFNLSWQLYVTSAGILEIMLEDARENNYCYPFNNCSPLGSCTAGDVFVADDRWHHVGATRDVTGDLSLYVDGESRASCEGTGIPSSNNFQVLTIGSTHGTIGPPPGGIEPPTWFFPGLIDEPSMWNIPMTDAEIEEIFISGIDPDAAGLVGYWNFDDSVGQEVSDLSRAANHGFRGATPEPDSADPEWLAQ